MNVGEFIAKWRKADLKEKSAAQEFFTPPPSTLNPSPFRVCLVRYLRLVPRDADCAAKLAKRTLTNVYNQRPTWLADAHRRLDEAVFAAYGWPPDLSDDQILERLLELNLARSTAERGQT
jgi:hypothetical protein